MAKATIIKASAYSQLSKVMPLKEWWQSVDKILLYATGALILIGIVLGFAASPAAAARLHISNTFHFIERQFIFLLPALTLLISVSFLSPLSTRRLGVLLFPAALFLILMALMFGPNVNGAHRWISLGAFSLQPSEFAKTGFIISAAWLLAEGQKTQSFPGGLIAMLCYAILALMLLLQPDYGQWILVTAIWGVMFFIAGWSWLWIIGLGITAIIAATIGYLYTPHVARRIDAFLNPETADTYQTDKALEALASGGAFGRAEDMPAVKYHLPDAHTDYIFAVAGEEFGFLLCALILLIYAVFVFRAFYLATRYNSVFMQCAVCGLSAMIGLQAIINIGVNLNVIPSKGMTLPLISYGGSSLLATGLAIGFVLALTRKRPAILSRREVMP
ncbi:MAG: FtsW/RodA/SpoVE family cell cycle protein [bacterium]